MPVLVTAAHEDTLPYGPEQVVASFGKRAIELGHHALGHLAHFGRIVATELAALRHPKSFRAASVARHVYETGIAAIPIVALIAFFVSVIIAYIGASQLRSFGATIYTVNLITVGVLRELGVLLTAVIVAGRSGSAFAAEIGVMQLNDEVDALKSIGINPVEVLVVPRVIGLIIALPLLTVIADAMGLAGGALLSKWLLDIFVATICITCAGCIGAYNLLGRCHQGTGVCIVDRHHRHLSRYAGTRFVT